MHRAKLPITVLLLGLLLPVHELRAQTGSLRVTVPSPTAASLGRFGDVPVNLYTGIPDISIPLFTVKGRTLELPITLRYHAGGIRVEEIGGWAGLGWTLEAGGVITRTVRGNVDEFSDGYFHTGEVFYDDDNWPEAPMSLIQSIKDGFVDGEPDRFFFSFAGRSGQFVMGPTTTSDTIKEYRTIPHQKLRIRPTFGTGGISEWEITTEDGTVYTFSAVETTKDLTVIEFGGNQPSFPEDFGNVHNSSWYLTEIRAPGGDVIDLFYGSYTAQHEPSLYMERFDQRQSSMPEQCVPTGVIFHNEYEIHVQRLDSIKSAMHTVVFDAAMRSDALSSDTGNPQERRLDRITVRTPSGTELRRFQFTHGYYAGNRLRLDSVQGQAVGEAFPPYTFTYDSQPLPERTSYSQDHWGYYNGKSNNTLVPAMPGRAGLWLPGADRSPNEATMKAGILTRITYPTGGYNEFVFESNDYSAIGMSGTTPIGLGPEQSVWAESYPPDGVVEVPFTVGGTMPTIATVNVAIDPTGCITFNPPCPIAEIVGPNGEDEFPDEGSHSWSLEPGSYTLRASENGSGGFASINVRWRDRGPDTKKTAGGLRVAEIRTGDGMGNETVRRYRYTLQSDTTKSSGVVNAEPAYGYPYESPSCSYFSRSSMSKMPLGEGPIVGYREVTVLHGANGEHGRTRHTFRSARDIADEVILDYWPFSTRTSYEWKRGQPTGTTEYNAAGQMQQRMASSYGFRDTAADSSMTTTRFRGMSVYFLAKDNHQFPYFHQPFEIISAWVHPSADTSYVYGEAGGAGISTVKTYQYGNPVHMQLSEVQETNSDGTQRITRMKYPADYAVPPGASDPMAAALAAMQGDAHMHSQLIERWVIEKTGSTENVLQAQLTTFKAFPLGRILPYRLYLLQPNVP